MTGNAGGVLNAKKLAAIGLGLSTVAAAFMSVGAATASADITEVAPRPNVTSRQSQVIDQDALRRTAIGEARGVFETRSADEGTVSAQGEVRDSVKAVPGTTARPFNLTRAGVFRTGAPIGSW